MQGVGFRWECASRARAAGVAGFVRNLPDGRVEAAFEGPAEAVERMVAWCQSGPSGSRVETVEASDEQPDGTPGFEIRG